MILSGLSKSLKAAGFADIGVYKRRMGEKQTRPVWFLFQLKNLSTHS